MKKKETRGRPQKQHEPVNASFDEVLKAIAGSKYKDEKTIKKKRKKK
jgi:hypothetical protein